MSTKCHAVQTVLGAPTQPHTHTHTHTQTMEARRTGVTNRALHWSHTYTHTHDGNHKREQSKKAVKENSSEAAGQP